MSYDILAAFELDYDGKSDETEVAKRVARELDLGDPVEQNRHFEREALNHMPSLEWRVDNLPNDASDMFEELFKQLTHMRAFGVWRSDDVPIFYWCAEDWLERVEGAVRRDQAGP